MFLNSYKLVLDAIPVAFIAMHTISMYSLEETRRFSTYGVPRRPILHIDHDPMIPMKLIVVSTNVDEACVD